ncbi:MAG: hypothetical protein KDC86_06625 [Saprospiraceae bacterium]|nr:hypothetical protein [Saprospiraceae bacterium]
MQDLIELIRSINISRVKSGGLWNFIFEQGSLMEQLCDAIYEGKVNTDQEALELLYPGERPSSKYANLKERLKERILNVVFLLEFRSQTGSDRQKAYMECNKKWAAAMVLMSKNAKGVSVSLLESMLKQSLHYEFTELTLSILSSLRLHYGTIYGDVSKYNLYREMYRKYQQILLMENEAEDAYTYLVSHFVNSKASKTPISDQAYETFALIEPHMKESDSFRLHLCGRLIQVMIHSSKNDYASTAIVCEDAIAFFTKKEFESNLPLQAFYYQLIVCYIQLQEFEKGAAIIEQYQSIFDEGSFNWFKLQELFFLLAMYTKHYQQAFEVCEMVLKKLRSGNQPSQIAEMWKIYEAYAQFLIALDKIQPPKNYSTKFRVNKFLNEIPTYSKDKQGMNIPILIIQILFSIMEKNVDQTIDRIEAIEKYCSRYLKQNETFRSSCFIKALLQIPAASFHPEIVLQKAQKYIDMLETQPLEVAYQTHEIEIIPYEHLWDLAMESLGIAKGRAVANG